MGNKKYRSTGKVLFRSDDNFDWTLYDDGYTGGSKLKANVNVKTSNVKDKVYSHEKYAQETYNILSGHGATVSASGKDERNGVIYNIVDMRVVSPHEVIVDADNGNSMVIDLNKEKSYVGSFNNVSIDDFINAIKSESSFKKELLESGVRVKMTDNRASLQEGRKSYLEEEFIRQYNNQGSKYAYEATVLEINNGGYIVDVLGMKCFLPGSLAAAGILNDFSELLGKKLMVMVANYLPKTKCWVVSHKKYIEYILPAKIESELKVGQTVNCKVSGCSKNGIFVSFQDSTGEWIFTGLCHRTVMSSALVDLFDHKNIIAGDMILLKITDISVIDDKYRIVLGDKPEAEKQNSTEVSEN